MIEISEATRRHLVALFSETDAQEAGDLLARECADNLPLVGERATPTSLERIRFAALRLSAGSLDRLREAVSIARTDWRDLLVAAGFAHDVRAHESWSPLVLNSRWLASWKGGELPPGVIFRPAERVEVLRGDHRGIKGTIVELVALEPVPRYLVELESGGNREEYQPSLRTAG